MGRVADEIVEDVVNGKTYNLDDMIAIISSLELELEKGMYREVALFEMLKESKKQNELKDIKVSKLEETIESLVEVGF